MTSKHKSKFKCKKCDKTFQSNQTLISHMDTVHSKDSQKENDSDESSILKSFISESEEIFSDEAYFECKICDGEFIDEETLNHHNDKYHKPSPHEVTFFNPSASH